MPIQYLEGVGDQGPSRAGFSLDGGQATGVYQVFPDDLHNAITDILGSCEANGEGGLTRTLPAAHPQFPWLYASAISSVQGVGHRDEENDITGERVDAAPDLGVFPITDTYWQYPRYLLTTTFTPRAYDPIKDEDLESETVHWWNDEGEPQETEVSPEWWRFTDWGPEAASEFLTFQQGQMWFVRTDTDIKDPTPDNPPHSYPFPGLPRIFINKSRIAFTWFQVPFDFVRHANSYIRKWQGRVNQLDFMDWKAGSLLYLTYRARRWVPPVPERNLEDGYYSTEKLCDVEFLFEEVNREAPQVPTPAKGNWIAAGHNLHPWHDRNFYYAILPKKGDENTRSFWHPSFESCPFQLLFRDPSV